MPAQSTTGTDRGTWTPEADLFERDTDVADEGAGQFAAVLTDHWDRLGGEPLGGYTLATALRALTKTMRDLDPIVVSAFFLKPAVHGDAAISTEVIREGRRMSTGSATLSQGGKSVLQLTATYGDLDREAGRTTWLREAPQLPPPEDCTDPLSGLSMEGVTIKERVAYRFPALPGWRAGAPSGDPTAEFWMRLAGGRPADLHALPLLVDAWAPMVLELGEVTSSTLQLTISMHKRVSDGWLACRAATHHVVQGHHDEDFEIWDNTGVLLAQSRQHAVLPTATSDLRGGPNNGPAT